MKRRTFVKYAASGVLALNLPDMAAAGIKDSPSEKGLTVKFLGTGAADWTRKRDDGEFRRFSSLLVNRHILIDMTGNNLEMLGKDDKPDVIFYTHSHADHYSPETALRAGVKQVYVNSTWFDIAKADFTKAAKASATAMPEIIPTYVGQPVRIGPLAFTPLPANHVTAKRFEQTVIYLIESSGFRLLYATDTGGLTAQAMSIAGFDKQPLNALIMEATQGMDFHEDYRMFTHSSVADVKRTVNVLTKTKQYRPKATVPVYLTHLAFTMHPTQAELEKTLPQPLKAAYDGLEVAFL